jgi:hypothetical protein
LGCGGKVVDENLYLLQDFEKINKKMATKIWKTDGTTNGTELLVNDSARFYYESYGLKNKIFLIGFDSIYMLDKTAAGGVKAVAKNENNPSSVSFFSFKGMFYSSNYTRDIFWRIDGTPGKMQEIDVIKNRVIKPSRFIEYKGYMYFSGIDAATNKKGLWRTDFESLTFINDFLE